jgi:hypothetical protein
MKRKDKSLGSMKVPDGYLLNPEFATMMHTLEAIGHKPEPLPEAGPNTWDQVTREDYGPEHDYWFDDQGTIVILHPVSNACLQWCYAKLPEDAPRWGAKGYVIEHRYWPTIKEALGRDDLMSREEFEEAMEESHQASMQWENR